jgi:hypothetical protein
MEQDNQSRPAGHGTLLAVKSWTAYINTVLLAILLFGFALPLSFRYSELLAAAVMVVSVLIVGYRILLIRSVQLYYDDVGVWLYSGILPWAATWMKRSSSSRSGAGCSAPTRSALATASRNPAKSC